MIMIKKICGYILLFPRFVLYSVPFGNFFIFAHNIVNLKGVDPPSLSSMQHFELHAAPLRLLAYQPAYARNRRLTKRQ